MADNDPFVGIAGAIGGIFLVIVLFVMIFASSQAWILMPIVFAMALMGIFLGYFALKAKSTAAKKRR